MNPTGDQLKVMVRYYAVYPGGRRCLVTRAHLEQFGAAWVVDNPGLSFVTVVEEELVPIYGELELLTGPRDPESTL